MVVAACSLTVTSVAVLGGLGVLPSSASRDTAPLAGVGSPVAEPAALTPEAFSQPRPRAVPGRSSPGSQDTAEPQPEKPVAASAEPSVDPADEASGAATSRAVMQPALPADSGRGRRVVFSEGQQRVWLVSGGQRVKRSYLVSGSAYDNLDPGTYEVYSRSEQAWGVDGSGTMKYFVRFTQGDSAAIGFHDIPVSDGRLVQTPAELGTPLSHGCIRQLRADARVLWRFAPLGTTVVVTA